MQNAAVFISTFHLHTLLLPLDLFFKGEVTLSLSEKSTETLFSKPQKSQCDVNQHMSAICKLMN